MAVTKAEVAGVDVGVGVVPEPFRAKNRTATSPTAASSNKITIPPPSSIANRRLRRGGVGLAKAGGANGKELATFGGSLLGITDAGGTDGADGLNGSGTSKPAPGRWGGGGDAGGGGVGPDKGKLGGGAPRDWAVIPDSIDDERGRVN